MKKNKKFEKYYAGIISFEELENDDELNTPRFVEKVDFALHDRNPKINKEAIKDILDSFKYLLY